MIKFIKFTMHNFKLYCLPKANFCKKNVHSFKAKNFNWNIAMHSHEPKSSFIVCYTKVNSILFVNGNLHIILCFQVYNDH